MKIRGFLGIGIAATLAMTACSKSQPVPVSKVKLDLKGVEQLTVVSFPNGDRPYTKVILMNDGTALKRDLSSRVVFSGTLPPERFATIARTIAQMQPTKSGLGDWQAALVLPKGDQKLRASKSTFNQRLLRSINQELSTINWNQI